MELPKTGATMRLPMISSASSTAPLTKTARWRIDRSSGGGGGRNRVLRGDLDGPVGVIDRRDLPGLQLTAQHHPGQPVLDLALDQPSQRSRAEIGVVALPRQVGLRPLADLQPDFLSVQPLLQL